MAEHNQGFTDQAAKKDLFDIKKYIDGLTTFIETCNTPMTISIQGAWGTGKTSIMQIVNSALEKNGRAQSIWFNTWQFSQFNMDNELAVSLLTCLLDELQLSDQQKEEVSRTTQIIRAAQNAGRLGKELALSFLDAKVGGRFTENLEKGLDRVQEEFSRAPQSPAGAIKNLKEQFEQCVNATLTKTGKDRIVVFIDDLDRLEPRKAVELLEVLKLFLDCEHCVFVLAIDYDVVCRGVEAKYGNLADDKAGSAVKGRSFFDKIIQVPFKMPVAEYNIGNYVASCFREIGISCSEKEIEGYKLLIERSIGTNPRSMKRLFNAYLLLTIVVTQQVLESDRNKQLLFAVLCMQHAFEKVYNYIVEHRETISQRDLSVLESSTWEELDLSGLELTEEELDRLQPFMEQFNSVLDIDGNGDVSDDEMNSLRNVLGISTITSSGEEEKMTRRTIEVSSAAELALRKSGPTAEEIDRLVKRFAEIGPDVICSYRNNKHVHVLLKTGEGKSFADIFMRKDGFAIDCLPRTGEVLSQPAVAAIFERFPGCITTWKRSSTSTGTTFSVKDEKTCMGCIELARACYASFKEEVL